jgi:hypothetical protein
VCGAKHGDVVNELFKWFYSVRANKIPVDDRKAKEKADKILRKMGTEFKCSNEWIRHFKEHGNITWHAMSRGVIADADSSEKGHKM